MRGLKACCLCAAPLSAAVRAALMGWCGCCRLITGCQRASMGPASCHLHFAPRAMPPCRLVFYLCFNAFPSYDDVDSWEGTVKSLSALCCMGGALGGSANVGGRCVDKQRGPCMRGCLGRLPICHKTPVCMFQLTSMYLTAPQTFLPIPAINCAMQRAGGVARNRQVAQPVVRRHRYGPHRSAGAA